MGRKLVKTSVNKSNKSRYDSLKAKTPEAAGSSRSGDKPNPSLVTDEDIVNDTYVGKSTPPPITLDTQDDVLIENDMTMETDNTDFIVIPRPSPFACAATIAKMPRNFLPLKLSARSTMRLCRTMHSEG